MSRKQSRIAAAGLGLGALALWFGAGMDWISVTAFDDKAGTVEQTVSGSAWSTELTAVALLLAAGCVAGFALRRLGRRIVGVVCAVAAAAVAWVPVSVLTRGVDPTRVHELLTSGLTSQRASAPVNLNEWAELTELHIHAGGPALAIVGAAVAFVAAIVLAMRPGNDAVGTKYERATTRKEKALDDLEREPDSGRTLWDALDADIDPTDQYPRRTP